MTIVSALFRLWRLLVTALAFSLFAIGGLVLGILILPVLAWSSPRPEVRRRRSRAAISLAFRLLANFMRGSGILSLKVIGGEGLGRPGQLIVANHPSLIDVVFLIGLLRDTNCIVKQGLWHNPCSSGPVRAAQYISNDGQQGMLEQAAHVLREGQSLIVFPEGTRTAAGQLPRFQRSAASIALRGAQCITPVVITIQPSTLTKAEPWYRIPARKIRIVLQVGPDLPIEPAWLTLPHPIAARRLNQRFEDYFLKELRQS